MHSGFTRVGMLFGALLLCQFIASAAGLGDDLDPFFRGLLIAVAAGVLGGLGLGLLGRFSKPDESREGDRLDMPAEHRATPRRDSHA